MGGDGMSDENEKVLIEIHERIVRVETKIDNMTNAKDIAQEANQSARSAHHRLNTHVKVSLIIFSAFTTGIVTAFFLVIKNLGGS